MTPKLWKKWPKLFGRRRPASPAPSATPSTNARLPDQGNEEHGSKASSTVATKSYALPSPSATAAEIARPAAPQAPPPALPAKSAPKPPSTESTQQPTPVSTDHDINNLCTECSSVFLKALSHYDSLKDMFRDCDGSKLLVHNRLRKRPIPHHGSFHELKEAARAGCHLCSLIEFYCTGYTVDWEFPILLSLDLRDKDDRGYAFHVRTGESQTEIHLALKGTKNPPPQQAKTHYHPDGGIPEAMFDMIRDWLQQCEIEHKECHHNSPGRMPTRLVDVGTLDSSTVRLIEVNNGLHAPYLTLSHCWGQNPKIYRRTSGGNFEVPLEELPRTFRDAITATRRLGFAYLWVDSLCIIQDDEADWEHEAAKMASVYTHGVLNLAASYSANSHGGLMLKRGQVHVTPCCWKHKSTPVSSNNPWGKWMKADQVCWTFDPQSEFVELGTGQHLPLVSRGWVLQEHVLSPRTVHFLPGEIIWECRQLSARESLHHSTGSPAELVARELNVEEAASPEASPVIQNGFKNFLSPGLDEPKSQSRLYRQWYDMIEQYTDKDLTKSEDRLPAIWALAQRFQDVTGNEYCSGLWKEDLLTGLLFRRLPSRIPDCRTSQLSHGPSWSWASIECGVKFQHTASFGQPLASSSADSNCLPKACLQKLFIVPTEPPSSAMGRTCSAWLGMRTFVRSVVGRRLNWNPYPAEKVAEAMGVSTLFCNSEVWRNYERLNKKYESSHRRSGAGISREEWIRQRARSPIHVFKSRLKGTDRYFGWSGTMWLERELWEKREESRGEMDKILESWPFELDFDTKELAKAYEEKAVRCLHVEGGSGLLVEPVAGPNAVSKIYRRIGVYFGLDGNGSDGWEPITVILK
ncbi:hypothetical protein MAPG_07810 [Magnaporthiopsis poae ATCC 64411]|uniref:Heterokaryon incompatibility domain-containing protein n=1 Tax=Magnaporthiopsis poae (strain ATCC 64411 / 73-15) TaxID=644358 RepID=A0A0C4E5N6_MAGP6|nr:hypothetical protein MAPG_07810 [Magnaporthiopsis poae ATCC 64411]